MPAPILNYSTQPRARAIARRLWWAVFILACSILVGGALLMNPLLEIHKSLGYGIWGTPACPADMGDEQSFIWLIVDDEALNYGIIAGIYFALFLLAQWIFLLPKGSLRLRLEAEGRPMWRSTVIGAAVGMLISAGLLAVLLDWPTAAEPTLWQRLTGGGEGQDFGPFWLIMLGMWLAWLAVLWLYTRSVDRHTALTRIIRALVAGSILELLVAGPAWMAQKTRNDRADCYCALGSYTGLVFGLTALFWVFGPGVFLLFLREKRRLERIMSPPEPLPSLPVEKPDKT